MTPVEIFPDMDRQAKYKSQVVNDFYSDKRADRLPVEGTAIRGNGLALGTPFPPNLTLAAWLFVPEKPPTVNGYRVSRKKPESI